MRYLPLILLLIACNPAHRAERKVYNAASIDRVTTGKACADIFPHNDSVTTQIEYKQGDTLVILDTVYKTEVEIIGDTAYITKWRDRIVLRTDTMYKRVNTVREDTRKIEYANKERDESKLRTAQIRTTRNMLWYVSGCLLGVILLWIVYKVVIKKGI